MMENENDLIPEGRQEKHMIIVKKEKDRKVKMGKLNSNLQKINLLIFLRPQGVFDFFVS